MEPNGPCMIPEYSHKAQTFCKKLRCTLLSTILAFPVANFPSSKLT